jgi:hypothetical protein
MKLKATWSMSVNLPSRIAIYLKDSTISSDPSAIVNSLALPCHKISLEKTS